MHFGSHIRDIREIGVSLAQMNPFPPDSIYIWASLCLIPLESGRHGLHENSPSVLRSVFGSIVSTAHCDVTMMPRWYHNDTRIVLFVLFFFCFVYLDLNGDHGDGQDEVAQNGPRMQNSRGADSEESYRQMKYRVEVLTEFWCQVDHLWFCALLKYIVCRHLCPVHESCTDVMTRSGVSL